jgi:hypothetical protein
MVVAGELRKMNKPAVAYYKVESRNFSGVTKENYEILQKNTSLGRIEIETSRIRSRMANY